MKTLLVMLVPLLLTGCGTLREPRWGEETVPAPALDRVTETIRQGADYAAVDSAPQRQVVAQALAARVGYPKVTADDPDVLVVNLNRERRERVEAEEAQEAWHERFAGKELEGTGVGVWTLLSAPGALGLLALLIFAPQVFIVLMQLIGGGIKIFGERMTGTLNRLVKGIDHFAETAPEQAEKLKDILRREMDQRHKQEVATLRAKLKAAAG